MKNNRYLKIIETALDGLPFFNYLTRFLLYVKNPKIEKNKITEIQFRNSLFDIINSLGLASAFIGAIILSFPEKNYMTAIKIFNPFYVVIYCITLGITFSLTFGFLNALMKISNVSNNEDKISDIFYNTFCHSLRFYAACCLLLSPLATYTFGRLFNEGNLINDTILKQIISFSILALMIYIVFRLQIIPMHNYMKIKTHKLFSILIFIFFIFFGSKSLNLISGFLSSKIVNKNEICNTFKSGDFYNDIKDNPEVIEYLKTTTCRL